MYLSRRNKREWILNSSIKCKFHRQLAHASVAPSSSKRRLQRSSSAAAAAADSCFWMARASLAAFNSPHQLIWSRCVVILLASMLNMSCDVLWYDLRDLKSIYSTKSFTQLRLVLSSSTWRWLSGTAASAKKSIEISQFPDCWPQKCRTVGQAGVDLKPSSKSKSSQPSSPASHVSLINNSWWCMIDGKRKLFFATNGLFTTYIHKTHNWTATIFQLTFLNCGVSMNSFEIFCDFIDRNLVIPIDPSSFRAHLTVSRLLGNPPLFPDWVAGPPWHKASTKGRSKYWTYHTVH